MKKKNHARQLKNNSSYGLRKIHTRNLITKKKFLQLENPPPPPHNFNEIKKYILIVNLRSGT